MLTKLQKTPLLNTYKAITQKSLAKENPKRRMMAEIYLNVPQPGVITVSSCQQTTAVHHQSIQQLGHQLMKMRQKNTLLKDYSLGTFELLKRMIAIPIQIALDILS